MLLPDHKVMYLTTGSVDEAHYVTAILNSEPIGTILSGYIVDNSMSTHVTKNVIMPRFNADDPTHQVLVLKQAKVPRSFDCRLSFCRRRTPSALLPARAALCKPFYDLLYVTPRFLRDRVQGLGGSGHPDPDFRDRAVNNAAPSPTARRCAGAGSRTTSGTPTADPSAPADTATARRPARTS